MKTYIVMTNKENHTTITDSNNSFKINRLKKNGYQIIGRVKVHNGFQVIGVNVK